MVLSIAARFISPRTFWPIAFMGLSYPIWLVCNAVFSVYWFIQMRYLGLFSLLVIFAGWPNLTSTFQLNFSDEKGGNKQTKVLSYNCMLFDLYNWTKNSESRKTIFEMLQEESPDILCLQEFYTSEEEGDFNNTDTIQRFLDTKNAHVEFSITLREKDHWGLATFTRYPILKKGRIDFNTRSNNMCIFTDILLGSDTVRVYNLHLASVGFVKRDYKFIEEVVQKIDSVEEFEQSKNIFRRLKRAFLKRASQAELVARHIAASPYPVILCGDFNDTPSSYAYHTIKGNLLDAFEESGSGLGKTYNGLIPALRIDYILYSEEFYSTNYHRISESITDHYPVSAYLFR